MHTHTCTHTHMHTCTHTCTHKYTYPCIYIHTSMHTHTNTHIHTCTHTNTPVHNYTHTHTHTQTQIHIYIMYTYVDFANKRQLSVCQPHASFKNCSKQSKYSNRAPNAYLNYHINEYKITDMELGIANVKVITHCVSRLSNHKTFALKIYHIYIHTHTYTYSVVKLMYIYI